MFPARYRDPVSFRFRLGFPVKGCFGRPVVQAFQFAARTLTEVSLGSKQERLIAVVVAFVRVVELPCREIGTIRRCAYSFLCLGESGTL